MTNSFRRYEILLPLKFNDGNAVPDELFGQVILDLRKKFKGVSVETHVIRGEWEDQDQIYRDELVRVYADVEDLPENRQFFQSYKEQLKQRFSQLEIWMTSFPIDVI